MIRHWQSPFTEGKQLFTFPLGWVVAETSEQAEQIAQDADLRNQTAIIELSLDSAEAQHRLGVWGDVAAQEAILRGDEPVRSAP